MIQLNTKESKRKNVQYKVWDNVRSWTFRNFRDNVRDNVWAHVWENVRKNTSLNVRNNVTKYITLKWYN
jgi:hypothetical protein